MRILLIAIVLLAFQMTGFAQDYKRVRISKDMELIRLSENAYVHVTWEDSPTYGRFSSNGLIFLQNGEGYLFDTPANDMLTKQLVDWVADSLKAKVVGFVPNHWHSDCIGGLNYLQSIGVSSYANQMTVDIARAKGLTVPAHSFRDSLLLQLGGKDIGCYYLGAAHSMDNIVVWIPSEKVLFAGCMAKEAAAKGMGNTVDGSLSEWPKTIDKVMAKFPAARVVIPGHGQIGGQEVLKHTRELLSGK